MNPQPLSRPACSLLILLFGVAAYSNTFTSAFQFDDVVGILTNHALYPLDLKGVWDYHPLRFITHLSFAFNIYLAGFSTWSFHLLNLTVHVLTAFIVFQLTRSILKTPGAKDFVPAIYQDFFSLVVALVFAMHPVQTQAVTYISQRATSLATLSYLWAMWKYLQARLQNTYSYASVCLLVLAAMLTKEISITLPFSILLAELCFFPPHDLKSFGKKLLRWIPFSFFLGFIPLLLWMNRYLATRSHGNIDILPTLASHISRWHYLLTQFRVVRTYLRLLFVPVHQCLDYDYPVSSGFGDLNTWTAFALLVAILLLALVLLKKNKILSFGILWFFLTLSPESSIIPLPDPIFEHRLYLPMFGFAVFFTGFLWIVIRSVKGFVAVSLAIILVLTSMTYVRNEVWRDPFTLWENVIKESPRKWRGYCSLGLAFARERNDPRTAIMYFNKAVELGSYSPTLFSSMAMAYFQLGNTEAGTYYEKLTAALVNEEPHLGKHPSDLIESGKLHLAGGQEEIAVGSFQKAIKMAPLSKKGYETLALFYLKKGDRQKATAIMTEYLRKKKAHKPLFGEFKEVEGL